MKKIFITVFLVLIFLNISYVEIEPAYSYIRQNNFIWPSYYYADEQNVFYIDTNDFSIYMSDLERKNKVKIIDNRVGDTGFILNDGNIIYMNAEDGYLYSFNIIRKEYKKLNKYRLVERYGNFFILKDEIYYFDELNNVRKVSYGKDLSALPSEINVANNIYENQIELDDFIITWGEKGINKIDINNFEVEKIYFSRVYSLDIYKDKIFFIDDDKRVCSIDLKGNNLEVVSEERAIDDMGEFSSGKLMIDDNKLYYISYKDSSSELICINLEQDEKILVAKDVMDFYANDDRVIYFSSYEGGEFFLKQNDEINRFISEDLSNLSILDFKSDILFLLTKSKNPQNVYGEIFFLRIN